MDDFKALLRLVKRRKIRSNGEDRPRIAIATEPMISIRQRSRILKWNFSNMIFTNKAAICRFVFWSEQYLECTRKAQAKSKKAPRARLFCAHCTSLESRFTRNRTFIHAHFLTEGAYMSLKRNTFVVLTKSFFAVIYSVALLLQRSPLSPKRGVLHQQIIQPKISRPVKEPFSRI